MSNYLANPADGSSTLRTALCSLADYKAKKEGFSEETKATVLGTAIHCLLLEPRAFYERYMCQREDWGSRTEGEGRKKWDKLKAEAKEAGKIPLGFKEWCVVDKALQAAANHDTFNALVADGNAEVTAYANLGIPLKARADLFSNIDGILSLTDLKTTSEDISNDDKIFQIIFNNGYHFQAAHHSMVFSAVLPPGQKIEQYNWAFVTTNTPAAHMRVVTAPVDLLRWGQRDVQIAISRVLKAQAKNEWPGYPPTAELTIPDWAYKIYEC